MSRDTKAELQFQEYPGFGRRGGRGEGRGGRAVTFSTSAECPGGQSDS